MHENDRHIHMKTQAPVTPVVTTTPVVDPAVAPAGPVVVDTEYRRASSPFPYIALLVFAVLAVWGVMTLNDDNKQLADEDVRSNQVGYVEQDLGPSSTALVAEAPRRATTDRMAEDYARDMSRDMTNQQAMDADRIDETAARPEPYDNEVASVDLTAEEPSRVITARPSEPATLPDQTASRPAPVAPSVVEATPEVAVVDLDYSNRPTVPLSDQELTNQIGALEDDLERAEVMAKETGQVAGFEILDDRYDLLEDMLEAKKLPISETDRTVLTRQLAELRDELSAFQADLEGVVSAR